MLATNNKLIHILEDINKCLYEDDCISRTLERLEYYKGDDSIKDDVTTKILDRLYWLIERNRYVEARRLVDQELDNANGVTVEKCKRFKLNKTYCNTCKNYNCSNNSNNSEPIEPVSKEDAINILEDIKQCIMDDFTGKKALKTIDIYKKNLEISINPKIRKLVEEQKEIISRYGEDDRHTTRINNKISKELSKIYNS